MFCLDCWDQYLTTKVAQGETHITCPAVRCGLVVDDARIRRLARSPVVYERYVRFATKAFVDTNPAVRWCPAPGCGAAINALDVTKGAVACGCGFRFCFTCNREAHAPASCEQVKAWAAKCKDDSETTNWILANTMDCPGCRSAIEKNGGCNHVTCRQCHHEFCWVCRRPWKGHADFFQCNKYKKDAQPAPMASGSSGKRKKESQREKEAREREESRAALERYLHFYHRYLNHDKSRDFEQKIREMANNKMKELTETDATWLGVQFVKAAAEQLIVCRSMLKYSYIYSYYMPEGVAKNLFEYLQQALENTTEDLSAMLSLPAESLERVKCVNLTKLAECRAVGLLDAVEHGVTNTLEGFVTEANDSPVLSMAPAPSSSNASSPARRPPPSPALGHHGSALRATSPLANSSSSAAPVISNPRLVSPPTRTRLQPALSDASSSSATESSAPRPARSGGSGRPVS
jgi:ariadne-1